MKRATLSTLVFAPVLAIAVLSSGIIAAPVAADAPPTSGNIGRASASLPNKFLHQPNFTPVEINNTEVLADPADKQLLEVNQYESCPHVFAYNADTLTQDVTEPADTCAHLDASAPSGHSKMPAWAIDTTDNYIIAPDVQNQYGIVVVDDKNLALLGSATILQAGPNNSDLCVVSMFLNCPKQITWSRSSDSALVLTSTGEGVRVTNVDVKAVVAKSPPIRWSLAIQSCTAPLAASYATAGAYLTTDEKTLFVPCATGKDGSNTGVVKVDIAKCQPTTSTGNCSANEVTTLSPQPANDFIFDPVTNRGLMPANGTSEVDVLAYDPNQNPPAFTGSLSTGGPTGSVQVNFDDTTGRLYILSTPVLTVLDIRRTPFAPGSHIGSLGGAVVYEQLPVLAPDATHPYRRVLASYFNGHDSSGTPILTSFTVLGDDLPIGADPPPNQVDQNTYAGPVPGDAVVNSYYGATASGYGAHLDWVGGPAAAIYNRSGGDFSLDSERFVGGTRNVLAGWVQQVNVGNGTATGGAASLGVADGNTDNDYAKCTDVYSPTGCQALPNCPIAGCPAAPGLPDAPTPSAAPTTKQAWPYPRVSCSQPGGDAVGSADGTYVTTYGAMGPVQQSVLGSSSNLSANGNSAYAHCADNQPTSGSASASATSTGLEAAIQGAPTITVGKATSVTHVAPATDLVGAAADTDSIASGVHLDFTTPDGATHTVDIGYVEQRARAIAAGRPGTAMADRIVTVKGMVVDGTEYCGQCSADQLDAFNQQFGSTLLILEPKPDESFGAWDPTSTQPYNLPGSPGGFQAAVQANVYEAQGDQQFNTMDVTQAVMAPALRIVFFESQGTEVNRAVMDLAGAFDEAHDGISVFEPPPPPPPTPPNVIIEKIDSGVTSQGPVVQPPAIVKRYYNVAGPHGFVSVVEQVLTGLNYLVRSPLGALRMFAFLMVFGLPIFLMIRRHGWQVEN